MTGSLERFSAQPSRSYAVRDEGSASFTGGATRTRANSPPKASSRALRFAGVFVVLALLAAAVAGSFYFATLLWPPGSNGPSPSVTSEQTGSAEDATVIFSGKASELTAAPGNTITEDPNASIVWIRSSLTTAKSSGATDGISIKVPISLAGEFEGKRIRVTISAARGENAGVSAPFALAYSTEGAGNSGWRVFDADEQFKDFTLNYLVPRGAAGLPNYVAIWSDIAGRNAPLAVRSVTITGLP
jgi:hypothetical protein